MFEGENMKSKSDIIKPIIVIKSIRFFRNLIILAILTYQSLSFAQNQNVSLVGNFNDYSGVGFTGMDYSDCWGYITQNGVEIAILGVFSGTSVINVSNPEDPIEIAFFPGENSIARDIKTYKNYAYITDDFGGLDILNLSNAPEEVTKVKTLSTVPTHNLFIDTTTAVMYLANAWSDGETNVYSLEDPENPVYISEFGRECHDIFVQDGIAYSAEGFQGTLGIYDISDHENPELLTTLNIPGGGYVHNVWVSEDNKYMATTEETPGRKVKIWDIQDLENIEMVSEYLADNGLSHNAMILNNYIFLTHYESGLKILDISEPQNILEVGSYDTYPHSEKPAFNGAWGVYPFFENGRILVSDIQTGLYIFEFDIEEGPQIVFRNPDIIWATIGTTSETLSVELKNFGTEDLTINTISNPDPPFSLTRVPELPATIKPFESIPIMTLFSPLTEDSVNTTITISSSDASDPSVDVMLTGRGIAPAQSGICYASLGNNDPNVGSLITIDLSTGTGTLIGPTDILSDIGWTNAPSMAINSKGELFIADAGFYSQIYKVDPITGSTLFISNTGLFIIKALAFDNNDILYAGDVENDLYAVNIFTGTTTLIGNMGLNIRGMAFDPTDGTLWASDNRGDIYTIILETGNGTKVGNTGIDYSTPDICFDEIGNLYGSVGGGVESNSLISIDKFSGKGSIIGPIGFKSVSGMATRLDTTWMVKPQSISINKTILNPGSDTLHIQGKIDNPNGHMLTVKAIIESYNLDNSDTLTLLDDGAHQDSSARDNIFGGSLPAKSGHGYFNVSILAYPTEAGYLNNFLKDAAQFTTAGPVAFYDYTITSEDTIPNPGDNLLVFKIALKNESLTDSVINIKAKVLSLDTCASVRGFDREYNNIAPGEVSEPTQGIVLSFDENCPPGSGIDFAVNILSDGYLFWSDTFTVYVDSTVSSIVNRDPRIPTTYSLDKNFPNPFNPTTTIDYQLPFSSDIELSIYNLLGQKVTTLVSKQQSVGYYQVNWDASGFASGIYYYRIEAHATHSKQQNPFVQTRKLILVK
jgi:choice-of-anchor B domain-containing protein